MYALSLSLSYYKDYAELCASAHMVAATVAGGSRTKAGADGRLEVVCVESTCKCVDQCAEQ
eukprot:COSAG05_NODE_2509_length_2969_cov_16.991986_5_plen_61_part_00